MKPIIRLANLQDSYSIWKIRNQPQVRNNSHINEEIKLEKHEAWYKSYLKLSQNRLFILADPRNKNIIGYCRFDFHETFFLLSMAIDFQHQKQGFGSLLLCETLKKMRKCHLPIKAEVKKYNLASQKLFEQALFIMDQEKKNLEVLHYVYPAV